MGSPIHVLEARSGIVSSCVFFATFLSLLPSAGRPPEWRSWFIIAVVCTYRRGWRQTCVILYITYCYLWVSSFFFSDRDGCIESLQIRDWVYFSTVLLGNGFLKFVKNKSNIFVEIFFLFLRLFFGVAAMEGKIYRVIEKTVCTWWLQYRKLQVMFKVSPASLQTFIDTPNCVLEDTRLTLTPSVIPNSNYVIMVSDWNSLKYFCVFFIL
jgi:hypothetical protein